MSVLQRIKNLEILHPISALVAISLDALWTVFEIPAAVFPPEVVLTSGVVFVVSFASISLIQKTLTKDTAREALAKGLGIAVAVAIPFPVFGVLVGSASLVGTMARRLLTSDRSPHDDHASNEKEPG